MEYKSIIFFSFCVVLSSCAGGKLNTVVFPPSISYELPLGQIIQNFKMATEEPVANENIIMQNSLRNDEKDTYSELMKKSKKGTIDDRLAYLNKAIDLSPQTPDAYISKADIKLDLGFKDDALELYEYAFSLDNTNSILKEKIKTIKHNLNKN